MDLSWGSLHTHSKYSAKDALDSVAMMVDGAQRTGYGVIGLTDHGTIGGITELYRATRGADLLGVPGVEMYVAFDRHTKRPATRHMGILATTTAGWYNLIGLVNQSHRQFHYKPVIDYNDLAKWGSQGLLEGLWVTTGCWFGVLPTALRTGLDNEHAVTAAANTIHGLSAAFGDRVLVELQHHGISDDTHDDDQLVDHLYQFAQSFGLPVVVTTDSHYCDAGAVDDHVMLKQLSSWSDDPDSAVFPGDGYWLASANKMRRRIPPHIWTEGMDGLHHIMGTYDLKVPELDTFTTRVPRLRSTDDPEGELLSRVTEAIPHMAPKTKIKHWAQRAEEELSVINGAGFAPYILLTAEVTDYCRVAGIMYNARGSASGSLVCYLLGITSVDPMKWGLRFDRFLSTDRTKPPDIDLDVEHVRRAEVLAYLDKHYSITHIGTWRKLAIDADDPDKGSLMVKWNSYANKTDAELTDETRRRLASLARHTPYDGIGTNAAGILVVEDDATLDTIPQQYIASSKTMATSIDKNEVEAMGYVKLDVLGLQTLSALHDMLDTTGVELGEIKYTDSKVYRHISKGETDGVFQLSGYAARLGVKRMKPRKLDDIVAAMALFRPAALQSGATEEFLRLRSGQGKRVLHHEIIEEHVSPTYGVLLYQEQLIAILRDMGMDADTLTATLKAVKASNKDIGGAADHMTAVSAEVARLAGIVGMSQQDVEWLFVAMDAYASYGFNKAHAVSYGRIAYITAWFSTYFPVDFWAAMLRAYTGHHTEDSLRASMKRRGVRMLPPHVNRSSDVYSVDHELRSVRAGLLSIKGVGAKAAEEIMRNAPYESIVDLASKCSSRSVTGSAAFLKGHSIAACGGVLQALAEAGALTGMKEGTQ